MRPVTKSSRHYLGKELFLRLKPSKKGVLFSNKEYSFPQERGVFLSLVPLLKTFPAVPLKLVAALKLSFPQHPLLLQTHVRFCVLGAF